MNLQYFTDRGLILKSKKQNKPNSLEVFAVCNFENKSPLPMQVYADGRGLPRVDGLKADLESFPVGKLPGVDFLDID